MIDYCAKPAELAENPNAPDLFLKVANGDRDAVVWMWSLWCFTHLFDDLVDRDKAVTANEAAYELCRFIEQMTTNAFYLRNSRSLLALLQSAINRWVTGDEMARSDKPDRKIQGAVVRCGDVDVFLHVAYLVGGWDHMRAMSLLMDFDKG